MSSSEHNCKKCGGALRLRQEECMYVCPYCSTRYAIEVIERHTQSMKELFDATKLDLINNLRRVLYDAVTMPHISRVEVLRAANEMRNLVHDDFLANFFFVAAGDDVRELNRAINAIRTDEHEEDIPLIIEFLIKSISADADYLLALNNLVERAYKTRDYALFGRYSQEISQKAEQVLSGLYEPGAPRDIFIAYSSKDMAYVDELVAELEGEHGFTCFVAARNLKHGMGSAENYNAALEEAMDNCSIFLFVSSPNSRNMNCDAMRVEMKYIKKKDIDNAPAEYRQRRYDALPAMYKKSRIEYRVGDAAATKPNVADKMVEEFFNGYEWVYNIDSVAERAIRILFDDPESTPTPSPEAQAAELYQMGKMYHDQQNFTAAVGYYRQAAELGHLFSQNWLGSFYENGQPGIPQSFSEARKWYRMAAEQNDAQAAYTLGRFHEAGLGMERPDPAEAMNWYRKAAELGHLFAQNCVALCCMRNRNYTEAAEWFRKAAEQGHMFAQFNLACAYEEGLGVPRNQSEAVKWYRMAADQGHEDARDKLRKLGVR